MAKVETKLFSAYQFSEILSLKILILQVHYFVHLQNHENFITKVSF